MIKFKTIKQVFFFVLICITLYFNMTLLSFGEITSAYVTGTNLGLTIEKATGNAVTDNLGPGDVETSSLLLTNNGNDYFTVTMNTNLITSSEKSPNGGKLADVLILTVSDGSTILVDHLTFRAASQLTAINLGRMNVSSQKKLTFSVYFPEAYGNEYQGSTFNANWTFTTVGPEIITPPIVTTIPIDIVTTEQTETITDTEPPLGFVTDESTEIITTEKPPLGFGNMPKTGQKSSEFYVSIGAMLVLLGISIRIKK